MLGEATSRAGSEEKRREKRFEGEDDDEMERGKRRRKGMADEVAAEEMWKLTEEEWLGPDLPDHWKELWQVHKWAAWLLIN